MDLEQAFKALEQLSIAFVLNMHNFMLKTGQDSDKAWTFEKLAFGRRFGLARKYWATCETERGQRPTGTCDLVWKDDEHLVLCAESENKGAKTIIEDTIQRKLVSRAQSPRGSPPSMLFAIVYPNPEGEEWDDFEHHLLEDISKASKRLPAMTALAVQIDSQWNPKVKKTPSGDGWSLNTYIFSSTAGASRVLPGVEAVDEDGFFYAYLLCDACWPKAKHIMMPESGLREIHLRCRECGQTRDIDVTGYSTQRPHPKFPEFQRAVAEALIARTQLGGMQ